MQKHNFFQYLQYIKALKRITLNPTDDSLVTALWQCIIRADYPSPDYYRNALTFCGAYLACYAHKNSPDHDAIKAHIDQPTDEKSESYCEEFSSFIKILLNSIETKEAFLSPSLHIKVMNTLKNKLDDELINAANKISSALNNSYTAKALKPIANLFAELEDPLTFVAAVSCPTGPLATVVVVLNLLGWGKLTPTQSSNKKSSIQQLADLSSQNVGNMEGFIKAIASTNHLITALMSVIKNIKGAQPKIGLPWLIRQHFIEQLMPAICKAQLTDLDFSLQPLRPIQFDIPHKKIDVITLSIQLMKISALREPSDSNTFKPQHFNACTWVITSNNKTLYSDIFSNFESFYTEAKEVLPQYSHEWFDICNTHTLSIIAGNISIGSHMEAVIHIVISDEKLHLTAEFFLSPPSTKRRSIQQAHPTIRMKMCMVLEKSKKICSGIYPLTCTSFSLSFTGGTYLKNNGLIMVRRMLTINSAPLTATFSEKNLFPRQNDEFSDEEFDTDSNKPTPFAFQRKDGTTIFSSRSLHLINDQKAYAENMHLKLHNALAIDIRHELTSSDKINTANQFIQKNLASEIRFQNAACRALTEILKEKDMKNSVLQYGTITHHANLSLSMLPMTLQVPRENALSEGTLSNKYLPIVALIEKDTEGTITALSFIYGNQGTLMGDQFSDVDLFTTSTDEDTSESDTPESPQLQTGDITNPITSPNHSSEKEPAKTLSQENSASEDSLPEEKIVLNNTKNRFTRADKTSLKKQHELKPLLDMPIINIGDSTMEIDQSNGKKKNRSYFSMFFNSLWQGICSTFRKFFRRKKSNAEIKKVDPNHFTTKKPETLQQVPESSTVLSQVQNPMHP